MITETQIFRFSKAVSAQKTGTDCFLYADGSYDFVTDNPNKEVMFRIKKRYGQTTEHIFHKLLHWGE